MLFIYHTCHFTRSFHLELMDGRDRTAAKSCVLTATILWPPARGLPRLLLQLYELSVRLQHRQPLFQEPQHQQQAVRLLLLQDLHLRWSRIHKPAAIDSHRWSLVRWHLRVVHWEGLAVQCLTIGVRTIFTTAAQHSATATPSKRLIKPSQPSTSGPIKRQTDW